MRIVEHYPLAPGEMMKDQKDIWFVCCPHCGTVSNIDKVDNWFECPECKTMDMTLQHFEALAKAMENLTQKDLDDWANDFEKRSKIKEESNMKGVSNAPNPEA